MYHPPNCQKRLRLGQHQLKSAHLLLSEAAAQGDGLGHDELPWPLRPPHRAPRQNRPVRFMSGGSAEGDSDIGDEPPDGEWASNSCQTSVRHVPGDFFSRTDPSSHRRQESALVLGQHLCLLGEGRIAGQQSRLVSHRKPRAIVQDKVHKMGPTTSEATLIENVRSAWRSISADVLDNLLCEMPKRMRACVKKHGDFINK